jgi:hypothetical protein
MIRMIRQLWSHMRDIMVISYPNKIVYDIPIYSETLFKKFKHSIEILEDSKTIRLTIEPIVSFSKESLN